MLYTALTVLHSVYEIIRIKLTRQIHFENNITRSNSPIFIIGI